MTLNPIIHKNILVKVLKDIYSDPTIGPILGFKGGTAAYLFYDLNRFSVDLDFDLLDIEKEDIVFDRIKEILADYGTIKDADKKQFTLFYLLSYANKLPKDQNVKVEISRRPSSSKYEVKSYLGIAMKVMTREDMFANKLCAMYIRLGKTNRDIFDVWYFLQNEWPLNRDMVEARTGKKFKVFIQECIIALENMSDVKILSGMGELVDAKQKVWVKAKLRTETIFLLKLMLENEK